jgi:hypothetical protein
MTLDGVERWLRGHDLWKLRELVGKAEKAKDQHNNDTIRRLQRILDDERKPLSDRHAVGE